MKQFIITQVTVVMVATLFYNLKTKKSMDLSAKKSINKPSTKTLI